LRCQLCLEPRFLRTHGAPCRTAAYDPYLSPLLGSGMPDAFRLRLNRVPKILTA
jgi:6-phosphofructokinase 1